MEEKRRKFSPEEKVRILHRHLVEKVALSDLCDEYGLNPTVFYRWQKMFFENGTAAFERREDGRTRKLENKVSGLQAKLSQKDEVIAEIMASHVALKKSLGES
jgi:transposase-like protein